jgi:citrate lyase gamma subunit
MLPSSTTATWISSRSRLLPWFVLTTRGAVLSQLDEVDLKTVAAMADDKTKEALESILFARLSGTKIRSLTTRRINYARIYQCNRDSLRILQDTSCFNGKQ